MSRRRDASYRSIFTAFELQPFWKPLKKAGLVYIHQIPRSVEGLLPVLTKSSAEDVLNSLKALEVKVPAFSRCLAYCPNVKSP